MAEKPWVKKGDFEEIPTWNFKENNSITGILRAIKRNTGTEKNSTIYTLELPDGQKMGVWGGKVIDSRLEDVTVGEEVRIDFLGLVEGQNGRKYNSYDVYTREVEEKTAKGAKSTDEEPKDNLPF